MKTTSVTLTRGDRVVEISNAAQRREMVQDLVTEEQAANKCSYDKAFAAVQRKQGVQPLLVKRPEVWQWCEDY
ncbi:MAG: hypothetical protein WCO56_29545 [Verrucomicrobiota bacterium]